MAGLLEIVFEDVRQDVVLPLLQTVVANADTIVSAECSEDFFVWKDGRIEFDEVSAAIEFDESLSIFINVRSLKVVSVIVDAALVRIVKYQGRFDMDISFDEGDVGLQGVDVVGGVFAFSTEMANEFEFVSCYFGMEPASDEATRFFTNSVLGPLK
ncbi:MAG: hypothetical protein ABIO21_22780 [Pseudomonas sp.]